MTITIFGVLGWLLIIVLGVPTIFIIAAMIVGLEYMVSRFLRFSSQAKGFRKWKRKYFPPKW